MNSEFRIPHSALLITDEVHPLLKEGLEKDGCTVDYRPDINEEEVLEIISRYNGLLINSKVFVGKEILDRAAQLKFVCRIGSGLDTIDLDYAKKKNVIVFNSPEGNRDAVAEHALGLLLNLMNNITVANNQVKEKQWVREANRGNELSGKTIGLIGYGNTAQAFAKILKGFDVKILAYDKYFNNFENESNLETIFEQATILSIHLPLTVETKNMIDYGFFSSFKKPIWFINTSRGKILRTADLLLALNEGKIISAALDVLENEKLNSLTEDENKIFEPLISNNRILLTPHIAGWTHESKRKIAEVLLEKIRALR
ncbi:MAG: phosphoglycerate dehydrogenase [Bacteroidetes bacterium]|nr:phosphoglycerate dehydrogenase [Bacteroidota bacterium]